MIPNYEYDFETMVISFQKLSVDAVSEDGFSQRSSLYNRWETILFKLSSDVSIHEKSIKIGKKLFVLKNVIFNC